MNIKKTKKSTFLKIQLGGAILALIVVLISGFFIFGPSLEQVALALNPTDYNKASGDTLNVTDWNRLDEDFIAKSGDTMSGPLTLPADPTLPMQAATRQYVDANAGGGGVVVSDITSPSGVELKMICGATTDTSWYNDPAPNTIGVDVAFPPGAFSATPQIITSIGGTNNHFKAIGGANIYFGSANGFTVFVTHLDKVLTADIADTWNWYLNWCAIGS